MFALVDCNNFYASCERVFRPDLIGKPIVVLSNNDGCVIARSTEAKELDIPMGAPAYKYDHLFKEKGITVFSSNYALYGDMSRRIADILGTFTPDLKIYSIDECFLKLDGFENYDLLTYGEKIKRTIQRSTGIPVSIGFAPTKGLAKLANKISKGVDYLSTGVYVMATDEERILALKQTKMKDIWGIGKGNRAKLDALNVHTALDFAQLDNGWVRSNMTVVGLRLKRDLEGKATLDLEDLKDKHAIATTRSFKYNYTSFAEIKERVSTFACLCGEKLRRQKSECTLIEVFLQTNKHRADLKQYKRSIELVLPHSTNSNIELSEHATKALKMIFKEGYAYKKAGVIVKELTAEGSSQTSLFSQPNPKHKQLMQTVDKLNEKMGKQKVRLGSQDLGSTWKMRRERLSPNYTTQLNDIITVKV